MNELLKNILVQLSDETVDMIAPEAVGALMGLPPGTIAGVVKVSKALLKGTSQTVVLKTYDDIFQRKISKLEAAKAEYSFQKAENVFWDFVDKEGDKNAGYTFDKYSPDYESARQAAEGFLMQSMREFERKKLDVLGSFYGRNLYYGNDQWEYIFQTQKMIERMSFRQIVLIRLISERFPEINPELCITAPDACVEVMELINYGIWKAPGAFLSQDNSRPIKLKTLEPTPYAKKLTEELMLDDIAEEDVEHIIKTLKIRESSNTNETFSVDELSEIKDSLTMEEYNEDEATLTIGHGKKESLKDVTTSPEDMAHVLRGKDFMKEATDNAHSGEYMQSVDCIMNALMEFKQCNAEVLYQSSIDDALKELISFFELCQNKGGLRILDGKKKAYEDVLNDLKSVYLAKCQEYLRKSEEKNKGYDRELCDKEIDPVFKN